MISRIRLSKFERVAGLFVLAAIVGAVLSAVSVAVKQGWFEAKIHYTTIFENADGVHAGTAVKMAGLNAGAVDDVELLPDSRVKVNYHVLGKFEPRIRKDSTASLIRPFIIGDRVLDISVGSESQAQLAENAELPPTETMDIMTVISGKKMGSVMGQVTHVMDSMQVMMNAFTDKDRIEAIIRMFDRLDPLIANLNIMSQEVVKLSRQATRDENLAKTLANATVLTHELNGILPELNRENPQLGHDLGMMTRSLGKMTVEMEKALNELGPEGRTSAKRALEALNEATVLMKAMQKSFLLRSSVKEVQEEESKARKPASDGTAAPAK